MLNLDEKTITQEVLLCDPDAVFGVRSSCMGTYLHHSGGRAHDGTSVAGRPFHTLSYVFHLHRLA